VRWDGGHKRDAFLVDQLGAFVEWVPVCPEVEAGMGTPRPTVQLVRDGDELRMRETRSGRDHSERMRRFARRRVRALARLELCGYVLKRDSPSCGMERVKVRPAQGMPVREGRGLFAEALIRALPELPVEEEGRLHDAALRENFVERIFAYRRLRDLFAGGFRRRAAVAFHTAHKLQILAHSPQAYAELGRLVAAVAKLAPGEFRERYAAAFMTALARRATRGRHANVLQHMAGSLREALDPASRHELSDLIHAYRRGLIPLVVPLVLIRHHARHFGVAYLLGQVYLDPHPKELMLRNHV
jgi:uncharacterized protein YbgA (DUF1722 family)/uncharacterized protein YbbK (DUF523 family)